MGPSEDGRYKVEVFSFYKYYQYSTRLNDKLILPLFSEADERVQRFYGILPKEVKGEVKTPRMVKQASKKNSKVKRSGSGEEDSESLEVRIILCSHLFIGPTNMDHFQRYYFQKSTNPNTQFVIG